MQTHGDTLSLGFAAPFKIEHDAETAIDVVFIENDLFTGKPVLETLVNLTEAISEVRELFIKTFITNATLSGHIITPSS
jgi:hypothetical protein